MNNQRPYVGIAGFTKAPELDRFRYELADHPLPCERQLMVGVLVSRKSLYGQPLRPEWAARYPKPVFIEGFIWGDGDDEPEPSLLKTLHFNTNAPDLAGQLFELVSVVPSVEAVQLNLVRPNVYQLMPFVDRYPDISLILQVGPAALASFEGDPHKLEEYLSWYGGLVDYALIDSSAGRGQALDVGSMRRLLDAVDWADLGIMPGVAGGLSVENIHELAPLLEAYPNLSWDAEGRLLGADGTLDMAACRDYLAASADLLARFA